MEDTTDLQGNKVKAELPSWSHNIDRIFMSFGRHQKDKQAQIKKIYKTLEGIQEAVSKEEGRYKSEVRKYEK